jgi:hypothetical protein
MNEEGWYIDPSLGKHESLRISGGSRSVVSQPQNSATKLLPVLSVTVSDVQEYRLTDLGKDAGGRTQRLVPRPVRATSTSTLRQR